MFTVRWIVKYKKIYRVFRLYQNHLLYMRTDKKKTIKERKIMKKTIDAKDSRTA
ncbi:hypothetical protein HMPREF3202_01848 [Prevotella bivia]|uniref:Uncharacterized protein n=1 Tax=Prevotella bivia TaxID=28125 RepID=A0A137SS78_9BACT|nr:hypothetical protein HMPREF3202_01848 [Prevotella bivia]